LALRLPVIGMRLVTVGGLLCVLLNASSTAALSGRGLDASLRPEGAILAACRVVAAQRAPTGADSAEVLHTGSFAA
jgi:hypothetical protein